MRRSLPVLLAGLALVASPVTTGSADATTKQAPIQSAAVSLSGGDPIDSTLIGCTAGWIAAGGTQRFVITYSGCTDGQPTWFRSGLPIGPTVFANNGFGLIRVNDPLAWQPFGGFHNGSTIVRPTASGSVPVGSVVCKSGRTTGTTCGVVRQLNVTINFGDEILTGVMVTSMCSQPGDNGGTVFAGTRAVGIVVVASPGLCTPTSVTLVLPVTPFLAATGLTLI